MATTQAVASPPAQRRRATRRQPALGTVCRLEDPAGARVGLVWNISSSGVSMLLPEPLEAGSTVQGVLATTDDRAKLPITLRVAHVAALRTGDYVVGAQFQKPITSEQMRPFLATSPAS